MRQWFLAGLTVVLVAETPVEQRIRKDVTFLASPALAGRGNGQPGLEQAAQHVAKTYTRLGLKPTLQRFGFVHDIQRLQADAGLGKGDSDPRPLEWGKDIEALGWSADASVHMRPMVFLGFGIQGQDYDDWGQLNLRNKVVIIGRRTPDLPVFQAMGRMERGLLARVQKLAKAKVAAVVVLEDGDVPAKLQREEGPLKVDVPVVSMPARALTGVCGNLAAELETIRKEGKPRSRDYIFAPMSWMSLNFKLERKEAQIPNVVAVLPGRDPKLKHEHIVVGAHLDHLGLGERHSMLGEKGVGQVHAGADDNASGTALLLELARSLKAKRPKRSVLFLHVSGEEEGLLGSAHWIQNPTVPLPSVKFMVNFDMVGRLDKEKPVLQMGGLGAPKDALARAKTFAPQGLALGEDLGVAVGGSDHMSFSAARIPTFFFFTGLHGDYHRPSDTPDKLNIPGMATVAAMGRSVVADLANADALPAWDAETAKLPSQGRGGGAARIAFGTIPDFKENPQGFRITGTSPGSTAESVGMKGGDILTHFGDKTIKNIYDFMEALAAYKPGDKIQVQWLRDGRPMQAEAILKGR